MPGIRTSKETFGTYDSMCSNSQRKGFVLNEWIQAAQWLNAGCLDVFIKDVFLGHIQNLDRIGSDRIDKTRTGSDRINKTWIGLRPIDKTRTGSEKEIGSP